MKEHYLVTINEKPGFEYFEDIEFNVSKVCYYQDMIKFENIARNAIAAAGLVTQRKAPKKVNLKIYFLSIEKGKAVSTLREEMTYNVQTNSIINLARS